MRKILLTLALVLGTVTAASAGELEPMQNQSFDLGAVKGAAYYTVDDDGVHLVATLINGDTGTPVRVSMLLAPGQRVKVSVPSEVDSPEIPVEFIRQGDRVVTATPIYVGN